MASGSLYPWPKHTLSSLRAASIVSCSVSLARFPHLACQSDFDPRKVAHMEQLAHQQRVGWTNVDQSRPTLLHHPQGRSGWVDDGAPPSGGELRPQLLIIVEHLIGDMLPAELFGSLTRRHRQPPTLIPIFQQVAYRPRQVFMILWRHQQPIAVITNHRAEPRNV